MFVDCCPWIDAQDDRKIVIFSAFSIFDCNCNFRVGHQLNNHRQITWPQWRSNQRRKPILSHSPGAPMQPSSISIIPNKNKHFSTHTTKLDRQIPVTVVYNMLVYRIFLAPSIAPCRAIEQLTYALIPGSSSVRFLLD